MYNIFPKDLDIKIDNERYIRLTRSCKLISGRNELGFIKWYTYQIDNKDELGLVYDCIAVSFARITPDLLKKAKERIIQTGVSKAQTPNIDANTGNIHPTSKEVIPPPEGKVQQLVLCNGRGPLTSNFFETDDCYCYTCVHKACYYPLIDEKDEERFKNDERTVILKAVWNALHNNKQTL